MGFGGLIQITVILSPLAFLIYIIRGEEKKGYTIF